MKLTKKFWVWVGQVVALMVVIFRIDLLLELLRSIPNVDLSQLHVEIGAFALFIFIWFLWLTWRGINGFYLKMDFVFDENDRRW